MPHVYAVALEKGGVGKTSISVNLAAAFARLDLRVLLIDLDAQRHASRWLGIDTEALTVEDSFLGVAIQRRLLSQCIVSTDEQIDAFIREKVESAYHPSCSCRMGDENDPMAVVDPLTEVRSAYPLSEIEPYRLVEEDVTFRLPVELRRELELAARN